MVSRGVRSHKRYPPALVRSSENETRTDEAHSPILAKMTVSKPSYFHGGCPGIEPGASLRSASELGLTTASWAAGTAYRSHHIYVTSREDVARAYAAAYLPPFAHDQYLAGLPATPEMSQAVGGSLYEVRVDGAITDDMDTTRHGISFEARNAKVVRIIEEKAVLSDNVDAYLENAFAAVDQLATEYGIWSHGTPTRPLGRPYTVGRNDRCLCGSGKKFKRCHGQRAAATQRDECRSLD